MGMLPLRELYRELCVDNPYHLILLFNPDINIMATARYTRKLINAYEQLQNKGLNLYLPNLKQYNPSKKCSNNLLPNDPVYSEYFGVAFFGGCYTELPYPESPYEDTNIYTLQMLRTTMQTNNWGKWVAAYFKYYQENQGRLGLFPNEPPLAIA